MAKGNRGITKTIKDIIKGGSKAKTKDEDWVQYLERTDKKPTDPGGTPARTKIPEKSKDNPTKER